MTDSEMEKDADECWLLWRKKMLEVGINPAKFPEIEIWQHAYRCGIALGKEIEREDCAMVAVRCASAHVAAMIRGRTALIAAVNELERP